MKWVRWMTRKWQRQPGRRFWRREAPIRWKGHGPVNVHRVLARVKEAIQKKRKAYARYRPNPHAPVETYQVACLDIKAGKTQATRANDYLWAYSYDHERIVSLRLGRVVGLELCEEGFNPAELMADWKKEPEWNLPRGW